MTVEEMAKRHLLGPHLVEGVRYHSPLPPCVAKWHYYSTEVGHSVLCLLEAEYTPSLKFQDQLALLVQVPVKTVLRSYRVRGGFVVVDVPFDYEAGILLSPRCDGEFAAVHALGERGEHKSLIQGDLFVAEGDGYTRARGDETSNDLVAPSSLSQRS